MVREFSKKEIESRRMVITEQNNYLLGIGDIINVKGYVLRNWRLKEELMGICVITCEFASSNKCNYIPKGIATYYVKKDTQGNPILVRKKA